MENINGKTDTAVAIIFFIIACFIGFVFIYEAVSGNSTHRGDWDLDILGNEFDDILEDLEIDDLLPEVGFD